MFVLLALLANFLFASQSLHAQNTVPGAVGTFAAQAKHERVTLTWVAPTVDGGSTITGYSVQYRLSSVTAFTSVTHTGTTRTNTITSLDNDSEYEFQVAAINTIGTGPYETITSTPAGFIMTLIVDPKSFAHASYVDGSFNTGAVIIFTLRSSYLVAPYDGTAMNFTVERAERMANYKIPFELGEEEEEITFCCNPLPTENQVFLFTYTAEAGDRDLDGITVSANSLAITGGFSFVDFERMVITDLKHPAIRMDGVNNSFVLVNIPSPGAPRNIAVKESGTGHVTIEWAAPDPLLGPINDDGRFEYRIGVTMSLDSTPWTEVPGGASTTEIRIDQLPNGDDLASGTAYFVDVRSVSSWTGLFKESGNSPPAIETRVRESNHASIEAMTAFEPPSAPQNVMA